MPGQLNWTTDPGWLSCVERGASELQRIRFRKIAFVPDFVLVEERDGVVRGRPTFRVIGIEFDKKEA